MLWSNARTRTSAPASPGRTTAYGFTHRQTFKSLGITPRDKVTLSYDLLLPDDWNPWYGGKLPGVGGLSDGLTHMPGGGFYDPRGFSMRTMWQGGGRSWGVSTYGYVNELAGQHISDSVNPSNGRTYGIDVTLRRGFDPLHPWDARKPLVRLQRARQRCVLLVELNTPGEPDGRLLVSVGADGMEFTDVIYRDAKHPRLQITHLLWESFYGGPKANETAETWVFENASLT